MSADVQHITGKRATIINCLFLLRHETIIRIIVNRTADIKQGIQIGMQTPGQTDQAPIDKIRERIRRMTGRNNSSILDIKTSKIYMIIRGVKLDGRGSAEKMGTSWRPDLFKNTPGITIVSSTEID